MVNTIAQVQGKRINDVMNRIHVAMPKAVTAGRTPCIPPGVGAARAARAAGRKKETERDLQVRWVLTGA